MSSCVTSRFLLVGAYESMTGEKKLEEEEEEEEEEDREEVKRLVESE